MGACEKSSLGTCMMNEMQKFVEVLEMYRPLAEFPMQGIFKLSRFEEGLPKSIILQTEKLEQQRQDNEMSQSRLPKIVLDSKIN